ncbi:hypothetical protein Tco_1431678, partial [Tanacetum coccineum]
LSTQYYMAVASSLLPSKHCIMVTSLMDHLRDNPKSCLCILNDDNSSPERVYYSSARSLSKSHTPTHNYFHSQRSSHRETVRIWWSTVLQ